MFSFNRINGDTFNMLGATSLFRFLSKDPDGDQTNGSINANGNYAATPTRFLLRALPGFFYAIYRMIVTVRDDGKFDSGSYGNSIVLTNGVHFVFNSDTLDEELVVTKGVPIKTNPDWGVYCYDTNISNYGIGTEQLAARWSLYKSGRPVVIDGDVNEYAGALVNDDLSGLIGHYFQIQGLIVKKRGT